MGLLNVYEEILEKRSNTFLHSTKSGHNGPYYDEELETRLCSHMIFELSYFYKKNLDKTLLEKLKKLADRLVSQEFRPMSATFYCRKNPKKDFSNGLIGQAWVIEALVEAYKITHNTKYIETAKEVFNLHPFDRGECLWHVVNVDGSYKPIDGTYNHQLWFAASGLQILSVFSDENIMNNCGLFLDKLKFRTRIHRNGLIKHKVQCISTKECFMQIFDLPRKIVNFFHGKNIHYKENGYHLFNLYGFALIKKYHGDINFFSSKKFKKILNYAFSVSLHVWLTQKPHTKDNNHMPKSKVKRFNIYGYPYNAPGFELPFIYKQFYNDISKMDSIVHKIMIIQRDNFFDNRLNGFFLNTDDPITLNARFYEFIRSLE